MAEEKKYIPQSGAGLIRYFDVEESSIKLKPEHVIIISILFGVFVLILKAFG